VSRIIIVNSFSLTGWLLASIVIHALLLWHFRVVSSPIPPPSGAIVVLWSSGENGAPSNERTRLGGPTSHGRRLYPVNKQPSFSQKDALKSGGGASAEGEGSPGLGNVLSDGGGVGVGGIGSPSGGTPGGTGSGGTGTGVAATIGKPGPSTRKTGPVAPVITVPLSIQRRTSPYESEVYAEVDSYALFTADLRLTLNVPGNQVCLDGDILRTYEREVMTHTVTDISKCRLEDYSDKTEMRCPKEAHTTAVTYNNHLSSPVTYHVNMCLVYDQSYCHWVHGDDGPDREICPPVEYQGIWAQGTMFHYQCAKSTRQTYSHPLQYEVRFVQDIEFPEQRMRKRILLREKRSVPPCP
jgi:hypothetical protein